MYRLTRLLLLSVVLLAPAAQAAQKELERTGGPYVPTPQVVVDEMLRLAGVGPGDLVYDLGSGDGRIVITVACEKSVLKKSCWRNFTRSSTLA